MRFNQTIALPHSLLERANCVAIIPDLKKGAFIFGARDGKGDISCRAAGGPGWSASAAETDLGMKAEILSYSRFRGVFAGVAFHGATLQTDLDANKAMYRQRLTTSEIVRDPNVKPTPPGQQLVDILNKYSPKETS